jgi:hypothetical protein
MHGEIERKLGIVPEISPSQERGLHITTEAQTN